jgi:hypothetical protein
LNLNQPSFPYITGSCSITTETTDLAMTNQLALTSSQGDNDTGWLEIYDLSNPKQPKSISQFNTPGPANSIACQNNLSYITYYSTITEKAGLEIIDFSNPVNPKLRGICKLTGEAIKIKISGKLACVNAGTSNCLQFIDISNPNLPELIGTYNTIGPITAMDMTSKTLYLSDSRGLEIINIGNPKSPILCSLLGDYAKLNIMTVNNGLLYNSDSNDIIIDVNNSNMPYIRDHENNCFFFGDQVSIFNNLIYGYSFVYQYNPPPLEIPAPKGGESWPCDTTQLIQWIPTGNIGANVSIDLYKNGKLYQNLSKKTPNNSWFLWTIPNNLPLDSHYTIKITASGPSATKASSANNFSIISRDNTPQLISPAGGEIWKMGTTYKIKWNSRGNLGGTVKIRLFKSGQFVVTISAGTNNGGSYTWKIPTNLPAGADYMVTVISGKDSTKRDFSNMPFSITL